jgi:hypothetical protein
MAVGDDRSCGRRPQAKEGGEPPAYWPASGDLRVENLTARYSPVRTWSPPAALTYHREQDGPIVLDKVSFRVRAGERVGVGPWFQVCATIASADGRLQSAARGAARARSHWPSSAASSPRATCSTTASRRRRLISTHSARTSRSSRKRPS